MSIIRGESIPKSSTNRVCRVIGSLARLLGAKRRTISPIVVIVVSVWLCIIVSSLYEVNCRNTIQALTSPKPKAAFTEMRISCSRQRRGIFDSHHVSSGCRSSQFREGCTNDLHNWRITAILSIAPEAPSVCPKSDLGALRSGKLSRDNSSAQSQLQTSFGSALV